MLSNPRRAESTVARRGKKCLGVFDEVVQVIQFVLFMPYTFFQAKAGKAPVEGRRLIQQERSLSIPTLLPKQTNTIEHCTLLLSIRIIHFKTLTETSSIPTPLPSSIFCDIRFCQPSRARKALRSIRRRLPVDSNDMLPRKTFYALLPLV